MVLGTPDFGRRSSGYGNRVAADSPRNSGRQAASNKPTREEQTKFAAEKFKWLRQIALNLELPRIASQFAILLLQRFNLEFDGVGWAGQGTLAVELGCSRETINRLFALLVKHGHLTYKRGGWGQTNRYRMAFKEATDVRFSSHQEQATDVTVSSHSDVIVSSHESILTNDGDTYGVPRRESAAAAAASGGPGPDGPPHRRKKGKAGRGAGSNAAGADAAAVPHAQELATLRGMWVRGWSADASEATCKAVEKAWAAALARGATPDAILAAAPKYIAAADAPRFLDKLQDWLNADSWNKPPPKRGSPRGYANGGGRSRRRRSNGHTAKDAILNAAFRRMQ